MINYGPSLLCAEFVWAELVMGRVCHGPSLLWAEMFSYHSHDVRINSQYSLENFIGQSPRRHIQQICFVFLTVFVLNRLNLIVKASFLECVTKISQGTCARFQSFYGSTHFTLKDAMSYVFAIEMISFFCFLDTKTISF